ncbi:MAG: cysteinyl-tRNA synthetase [Alphaproteobacteria bacterium]|nr:cysteinyl-tRNA synthetase [Alphaproteobacteria bacterium]
MALKLYNSKTRTKQDFAPIDPARVRMYVCGPTVYDFAHIGNARPVVVFDTLYRLLRLNYGADHVIYARNITDVDDKINARAREENVPIADITARTTDQFHADMAALNALPPDVEPRATGHIAQMIAMIESLIARGHAYAADGHVLFHVPSMPDYGRLSGRNVKEMLAGARVEVAPYKRDEMDFVLWKPSDDQTPGWNSPWGYGRPGWHIECSAMSLAHLGETFDIHGGGIDLIFPHHENELAQSACANGPGTFAKFWMHNGYLMVDGKKMSKSEGNFRTVRQLLDKAPGEALRLQILSTHYRQPFDWTDAGTREVKTVLDHWYRLVDGVTADAADIPATVRAALEDDLNTPLAIAEMHRLAHAAGQGAPDAARQLRAGGEFLLGLFGMTADQWLHWQPPGKALDEAAIQARIDARIAARKAKNFKEADRIRDELVAQGIQLEDGPTGTLWKVLS